MVSSITVEKISRYILKDIFKIFYGNTYLLASLLLWNTKMPMSAPMVQCNAPNTNRLRMIFIKYPEQRKWMETDRLRTQWKHSKLGIELGTTTKKVSEQQLAGRQDREHKHRLMEKSRRWISNTILASDSSPQH